MGGGLMQLVAYGAQDIYLTGNPQITFFKVVYRRHTNFAMESVDQTLNGSAALGNKVTATVSRNGDLVGRMYLEVPLTIIGNRTGTQFQGVNPGHTVISEVEVQIGGQQIDKHYGHWMEAWVELTEPNDAGSIGLTSGGGTRFQNMALAGGVVQKTIAAADTEDVNAVCRVPLQFWFNRNPGLALPLIALQYHEVKVSITLGNPTGASLTNNSSVQLWADYIYLDTDERRRFAQVSHEYLIEQVQHTSGSTASIDLNFNHPVKELVWTGNYAAATGIRTGLPVANTKLVLNGHDRFAERPREYFTQTQVWQHHTGTPVQCDNQSLSFVDPANPVESDQDNNDAATGKASVDEIAVYSFALKPEEHQPSGTCNFSRIDNAQLKIAGNSANVNVYAVNYNVLRVMSGMGGLAYSN
jgi:hypothetical protein